MQNQQEVSVIGAILFGMKVFVQKLLKRSYNELFMIVEGKKISGLKIRVVILTQLDTKL
jgi:hypothetical protein